MYYKMTSNGYILAIGTGAGGEPITEEEYNTILTAIRNKPQATETTDYMLRTDLTWEAYTFEPADPDPTTEEDMLAMLEEIL